MAYYAQCGWCLFTFNVPIPTHGPVSIFNRKGCERGMLSVLIYDRRVDILN